MGKNNICTLFYAYSTPISVSLAQSVLAQPAPLAGSHASALDSPQQISVAEQLGRHSIRVPLRAGQSEQVPSAWVDGCPLQ